MFWWGWGFCVIVGGGGGGGGGVWGRASFMFVSSVSNAVVLRPAKQTCTGDVILSQQMASVFKISLQKFRMLLLNFISAFHCTEVPKATLINVIGPF